MFVIEMKTYDLVVKNLQFAIWAVEVVVLKVHLDAAIVKNMPAEETHQLTAEILQTDGAGGNLVQVLQQISWLRFLDD